MQWRFAAIGGVGGKLLFAGLIGALAFHFANPGLTVPTAGPAPLTRAATPPAVATKAVPAAKPVPATEAGAAALTAFDDPFVVKRILDLKTPLHHGEYAWDDAGVPQGPIVITIDLAAEMLSVFRDGYEIGAAVILYGADSKPTPLGSFPILQKDARHVSNLYGAPMPYALRLTNDGVFVHASEVAWDAATHGCIGVPKAFAQKLFAQVKLGDRVIITKGKMMDLGQSNRPA